MLANLYMNLFLKHWRGSGRGEAYRARVISYADDFVILSRGYAIEALAWTKAVLNRLGLALNEAKTSIRDARHEQDRRDPGSRKSGAVTESARAVEQLACALDLVLQLRHPVLCRVSRDEASRKAGCGQSARPV